MTLQVPFESFSEAVERLGGVSHVYISRHPGGTLVTAAAPERNTLIAAVTRRPFPEVENRLADDGFSVAQGTWSRADIHELTVESAEVFVAATAYQTREDRPGLFVDAFDALPTQVQALRALYDEFRQTGETADIPFEEFIRLARPTTVILTPAELRSFARQKEG